MKILAMNFVLLFTVSNFSQTNDEKIEAIKNYCDSIENIINNSSGFPGDIFCDIITTIRNVRAIGMQETKISFYFMQKEDSVYDDGSTMLFIPQYNPPIKIHIGYNIAASQIVDIEYFYNSFGELCYYYYFSKGEYGNEEKKYWFDNFNLLQIENYNDKSKKSTYKKQGKYTKDEMEESLDIVENSNAYLEEYYNIFDTELIDK